MAISVVVATHQDPLGLYLTVFSLLKELQDGSLPWEIIIAADGGTSVKWEKIPNVRCLRIHTGSPQGTRDAGIREAKYDTVLCVESHVIIFDIENWLDIHKRLGATISFPRRVGETDELFEVFGTRTNWDGDLWIKQHLYQPTSRPNKTPQFGHACFMIDKNQYVNMGGYTLEQKGWGGEEPYLCLKTWMLGGSCWVIPNIWFAHYLKPGAHSDYRSSENFQRNIAIVRYVMTGDPGRLQLTPELKKERQKVIDGPFGGDLNKLKEFFKTEGIL